MTQILSGVSTSICLLAVSILGADHFSTYLLAGVAAAIILFTFKAPKRAAPVQASLKQKFLQIDLPGTFTVMAAIACYVLAFQVRH